MVIGLPAPYGPESEPHCAAFSTGCRAGSSSRRRSGSLGEPAPQRRAGALVGGILCGLNGYLSYGLALVAVIAAAVSWRTVGGLAELHIRYSQGIASLRPYHYLSGRTWLRWRCPSAVITPAALTAVLMAEESALSEAGTERIWLPFGLFLLCGLALLPRRAGRWVCRCRSAAPSPSIIWC